MPEPHISDWVTVARTAVCDDDECGWKHAGATILAADEAALAHARESGHTVNVYLDSKKTVTT